MLSCPSCLNEIVTDYEEDIKYNSMANCLHFVALYDNTLHLCKSLIPWTKTKNISYRLCQSKSAVVDVSLASMYYILWLLTYK